MSICTDCIYQWTAQHSTTVLAHATQSIRTCAMAILSDNNQPGLPSIRKHGRSLQKYRKRHIPYACPTAHGIWPCRTGNPMQYKQSSTAGTAQGTGECAWQFWVATLCAHIRWGPPGIRSQQSPASCCLSLQLTTPLPLACKKLLTCLKLALDLGQTSQHIMGQSCWQMILTLWPVRICCMHSAELWAWGLGLQSLLQNLYSFHGN